MIERYSTYEAKARFSEVLRKVRSGKRVRITYRGQEVAEIGPIEPNQGTTEDAMRRLEEAGILDPRPPVRAMLTPLVRRPGALERFLDSRE